MVKSVNQVFVEGIKKMRKEVLQKMLLLEQGRGEGLGGEPRFFQGETSDIYIR